MPLTRKQIKEAIARGTKKRELSLLEETKKKSREEADFVEAFEPVQGEPGIQGERGESITGPKGDQGDKGDVGIGKDGPQGPQGKSIKGDRGAKGDKGPISWADIAALESPLKRAFPPAPGRNLSVAFSETVRFLEDLSRGRPNVGAGSKSSKGLPKIGLFI